MSLLGFFVECFRAECFSGARRPPRRNSLMSMNRGLETVMITEDRFGVSKLLLRNEFKDARAVEREFLSVEFYSLSTSLLDSLVCRLRALYSALYSLDCRE